MPPGGRARGPGLLALLLLGCGVLQAGTGAVLKGRVVDGAGQPLAGVTVVVRNEGLSLSEQGTVTDAGGRFRFLQLPPGPGYRVRASLPGHAPIEFSDIDLSADQAYTLDIVLRPASEVQETIRVRARVQTVNPETVATSTNLSSEFVAGLPVLGRDYQDFLTLAPGVTDVNETGNPNVHGARDTGIVTLVDGLSTTDPFTGYYGQSLNIESIAEIEVITSGAPAEYSRAQGGFANIITKTGGNEFQGTFKFFLRSHRLDGDGAGVDPPELHGGLGGVNSFREQRFTDIYPFLSFSGPFVRDRLWYYVANEFFQVETPVNDLTQAFVIRSRSYRGFGKVTWQATPGHKVAFSLSVDRTRDENQGITSLSDVGSGYSLIRGGPTLSLKETAVLGPNRLLESSAAWFDNSFQRVPTTDPDTNHNGILFIDMNGDGVFQAKERDPGEDWDRDGRFDIGEPGETDLDGDGRITSDVGCEGEHHEDITCNGLIDAEVDANLNGQADPEEDIGIDCYIPALCPDRLIPGTRGNGILDSEDINGNGVLDTVGDSGATPFPFWEDRNGNGRIDSGEYLAPVPPDLDFFTDQEGRTYGPNSLQYEDHRKRFSLREDLSLFFADFGGSHDLKLGAVYEHEAFDRDTLRRPTIKGSYVETGYPVNVNNTAVGDNVGLFIQDTYKPLPNLTLGLGLRFDFESLDSFGFHPFDPQAERDAYDALLSSSGIMMERDGVWIMGLCGDPLYGGCGGTIDPRLAALGSAVRDLISARLTRHNSEFDIQSAFLSDVLGRDVDINDLLEAGVNIRRPEEVRWTNSNLAPRISLSWDPRAEGRSKAFASWNRYYDKLFLNSLVLEEGPDLLTRFYTFDADGVDASGRPNNRLGRAISQAGPSIFQIDRGLGTPYTDELTLGYQQEIAPELSVSLTYIRRDYRSQLQDIDLNHNMRIDPATGRPADLLGDVDSTCGVSPRSLCERVRDSLPDLYVENFFFNQVLQLGNFNTQTYRGWELELVRRLSRKWQMQASYTFSKSWGNAETFLSDIGNDPSLQEFETGYLDFDQRHVVKFNAIAYLPRDWRLGGVAQWASGLPYSIVVRRVALDDVGYAQNRLIYGELGLDGIDREGRNTHRNKAVYDFNVRVEKPFVIGRASASGFLEVFNLLNTDDLRVKTIESRTRGEPVNGVLGPAAAQHVLLIEGERRFGRRFQVGVRIDF